MHRMLIVLLLATAGSVLVVACGGEEAAETIATEEPRPPVEEQSGGDPDEPEGGGDGPTVKLKVMVWDDTSANAPEKVEIWVRGEGSWFPDLTYGADATTVGPFPADVEQELFIYPDGRDGAEISVPFTMTAEMNPEGSDRDALTVEIADDRVTVVSLAVEGTQLVFER